MGLQPAGGLIQVPHSGAGLAEPQSRNYVGDQRAPTVEPGDVQPEAFKQGGFKKGKNNTKMLCLCFLLVGMVPTAQLLLLFYFSHPCVRGGCALSSHPQPRRLQLRFGSKIDGCDVCMLTSGPRGRAVTPTALECWGECSSPKSPPGRSPGFACRVAREHPCGCCCCQQLHGLFLKHCWI